MTHKTLVILAAGLGSRYGGIKQLEPVSITGEIIADFSVYDAKRAGFDDVVFIIKKEHERDFVNRIIEPISRNFSADYAFQEITDLPAGYILKTQRTKPWGTGHAVYAARGKIKGAFAVINADDFYGADTFVKLSCFLSETTENRHCMVGFLLKNTVTEHGSVCRGVCTADKDAYLVSVTETTDIRKAGGDIITGGDKDFTIIDENSIVSMNAWGFDKSALVSIENSFAGFLDMYIDSPGGEFYLPAAVMDMIKNGHSVKVLKSAEKWYGMTYKGDLPVIRQAIDSMKEKGIYPGGKLNEPHQ